MPLKFGTSGLRGLVEEMTDRECYLFARAFLRYSAGNVATGEMTLGGDFRASTPRIMRAVALAARDEGAEVLFQGVLPTPALTLYGITRAIPSIMVTGSHIPDDRNGIKFNLARGEILKGDEPGIMECYRDLKERDAGKKHFDLDGMLVSDIQGPLPEESNSAMELYRERLLGFFRASGALAGSRVVFYQHSSTSREVIPEILEELGVEVLRKGFSDSFVPVDTEAVENIGMLAGWVREHESDALFSTDGDGDRPLVIDEQGNFIRGDILGIAVADFLGAEAIVTPVSCSTSLERSGRFEGILRTRIGSPYVVEGMSRLAADGQIVAGYEANGGFLTGSLVPARPGGFPLPALPTRDAALPMIAVLAAAREAGKTLSRLIAGLPNRFPDAELTRGVPAETGQMVMDRIVGGGNEILEERFGASCGRVESTDLTDGYRVVFSSGDIVHFRPSGNAPEFRCYTESDSREKAADLSRQGIEWVREIIQN